MKKITISLIICIAFLMSCKKDAVSNHASKYFTFMITGNAITVHSWDNKTISYNASTQTPISIGDTIWSTPGIAKIEGELYKNGNIDFVVIAPDHIDTIASNNIISRWIIKE
jgi:hypothetical protein